jgi:GT2 family glycosyltransferase
MIDVCLVSYRCPDELHLCLRACEASSVADQLNLVVVDNDSRDGTVELVRRLHPRVRVVANTRNVGFATGCNQAIALGSASYVLLLNPDTVAAPDAFERLARFLDRHPTAAVAAPQLLNEDGSLQKSAYRFPTVRSSLADYSTLSALFPKCPLLLGAQMHEWAHDGTRKVDWATGACLLFRRSALEEVGGLDGQYFIFAEEMDLCLRLRRAGWAVWYCPEAKIRHKVGASTSHRPTAMVLQSHRSTFRFFRKQYGSLVGQALRGIVLSANLARGALLSLTRSRPLRRAAGKDPALYWQVVRLCLSRDWCDASVAPADAKPGPTHSRPLRKEVAQNGQ